MRETFSRGSASLALLAIVLCALNLRAPITTIPPVAGAIQADLSLSAGQVGLLTGIPVLCFALFTPSVSALIGRFGPGPAGTAGLLAIVLGSLVRGVGDFSLVLVGTVLIGVGVTVGNVAVPLVVGRDFPARVAAMTGIYTATLNIGTFTSTLLTAPLAAATHWRWAVSLWLVIAIGAIFVWARAFGARPAAGTADTGSRPGPATGTSSVLTRPITWLLAVTFMSQASCYYGVTAWLPTLLADELGIGPAQSGAAASLFQLFAIAGALIVPLALWRGASVRMVAVAISGCWLLLPLGLLLAVAAWPVWVSAAGAAQGGMFAVVFTLVAQRTPDQASARRTSAVVQTLGYSGAALAPPALGAIYTLTGGWTVPLLGILALLTAMTVTAMIASRPENPSSAGA